MNEQPATVQANILLDGPMKKGLLFFHPPQKIVSMGHTASAATRTKQSGLALWTVPSGNVDKPLQDIHFMQG